MTGAIKTRMVSFVWGFSEATFFFFVPDIWLSRIVLEDKKEAYINIACTTLGALFGGAVLYFLALSYFDDIRGLLDLIPGVSNTMVEQTGEQVQALGIWETLMTGITSGVPYKIYASWSGYLGLSFGTFLLASAVIRTLRFTVVTGIAHIASVILKDRLSEQEMFLLHAACWIVFYTIYFYKFGL